MRNRILILALFVIAIVSLGAVAAAQEKVPPAGAPAGEAKPGEQAPKPVDESEEIVFERLRGLYFEGRGGVFFTFAGARGYSNAQPVFGFEFGYEFNDWIAAQLSANFGYQAGNPLKYNGGCTGTDCSHYCTTGPDCNSYHLDFGLTFFNLSVDIDFLHFAHIERFGLGLKVGGGVGIIAPSAVPNQGPVAGDVMIGPRFEYRTLLKHFTASVEADMYLVFLSGNLIPAFAGVFGVDYNF